MSEIRTYEYKLYLGISIEDAEDSRQTLILTKDAQDIVIDNKNCIISLNGFKFYRKIYEPGLIEAEVAIALQKTGTLPAMDEVTKLLLKRMANLTTKSDNSTETAIAQNYYVYEVLPQLAKNNGKASLNVKLMIYSLDKLMTLDKYCKAYVGMKLGKDILLPESLTFGFGNQSLLKACVGQLQQLKSSNYAEFIQPYLVQYNESFYDFMVRTANRCGELFYFEDGQLNLGLKVEKSNTTDTITDYQNVTMVNYSTNVLDVNPYYRDSVKELDDNGKVKEVKELNFEPIDKNKAGFPEEAFPDDESNPYTYNQEEPTDEYIYPLTKDKWTTMKYEMGFGHEHHRPALLTDLGHDDGGIDPPFGPDDVGIELPGIGQRPAVLHHVAAVEGQRGAFRRAGPEFGGGEGGVSLFHGVDGLLLQIFHVVGIHRLGMAEKGREEGARVGVGGAEEDLARQRGFFLRQTLFQLPHEGEGEEAQVEGDHRAGGPAAAEGSRLHGQPVVEAPIGAQVEVAAKPQPPARSDVFLGETEFEFAHDDVPLC